MDIDRKKEILGILKAGGRIEIDLGKILSGEKEYITLFDHTDTPARITCQEFNDLLTAGFIEPQKSNGRLLIYKITGCLLS